MTTGNEVEIGSLAEWASAAGSVIAAVVALYLAGSGARAAKTSQRPLVFCQVSNSDRVTGFLELRVRIENHSAKEWRVRRLRLTKPTAAAIVDERACLTRDALGEDVFDGSLLQKNISTAIELDTLLKPAGSKGGGGGMVVRRTDLTSRIFFLLEQPVSSGFTIELDLYSLEPEPDRFSVRVSRTPPWD